ncbi:MAG: TraB/GumN family protein [Ferruginibacter sp.]
MKRNFLLAMLCLALSAKLFAQNKNSGNSLLWKVTGNGLKKTTYLFGTFHLLTNAYADTLPGIINAYRSSDVVVGELIIDSSIQAPMIEAQMLKGTTLQKILPDTLYAKANAWFKEKAGLDIIKLDELNPITVMTVVMAITKQKYFPDKPGEVQLDTYFQDLAKKDGKKILGLENIEAQINALFNQLTLTRQVELLNETFKDPGSIQNLISSMNDAYVKNDLETLHQLMYASTYKPEEMKPLLEDRNNHWMLQLPELMKVHSLFVAVGALHLAGESGLVNQLRKKGYTVTSINPKNK